MKTAMELALQRALSAQPIKLLEGRDVRKDVLHCIRLAKKTRREEYEKRHDVQIPQEERDGVYV
jgi:hypothetical protein